jgi:hypothetical protein
VFWKTQLIFLIGMEILYAITLAATVLAAPVLFFLFVRGRRQQASRPLVARSFLCTLCLLLGFGMSETVCAVWQHRSHWNSVMPIGGLRDALTKDSALRFPMPRQRIDLPTSFADPPGDQAIDLVVLGESSAEGVPFRDWRLSIGSMVAWQLGAAIPDRPIRLQVLARAGDTLELQHLALAGLGHRPDVVIIYCGHNEFQSRLFASAERPGYYSDQVPGLWDQLVGRIERCSPLCSLIRESADKCSIALPPPSLRRQLVDVPVYTDIEYATLLADFPRRLDEMVSYAERAGALPILILPPANDTDYEPNRSCLPPRTPPEERESFGRAFLEARRLEEDDPRAAMQQYRALVSRQPGFAEAHYRLARLLGQTSARDEAYHHYVAARDLDGYPMRCLSAFQQVYRDVAASHGHRCILIDGQSYFRAIAPHALLDDELFQDAMHPSLRGQIALAQAVLHALRDRRAFGWPKDSPVPVIDPAPCAAHFGIDRDAWKHIALSQRRFYSLMGRLRYETSERSRKIDAAAAAADHIAAGVALEQVGLPNIGIPAPVPLIPVAAINADHPGDSAEPASTLLSDRPAR